MSKRVGLGRRREDESLLTRAVNSVFAFVRFAEFEILFVLFFVIAFLIFKDLEIVRRTTYLNLSNYKDKIEDLVTDKFGVSICYKNPSARNFKGKATEEVIMNEILVYLAKSKNITKRNSCYYICLFEDWINVSFWRELGALVFEKGDHFLEAQKRLSFSSYDSPGHTDKQLFNFSKHIYVFLTLGTSRCTPRVSFRSLVSHMNISRNSS